jgi:hypothetical protein
MVGFVEGRTAANPYLPLDVPVDAYCALIVDHVDFQPPRPDGTVDRPKDRKVQK